MSRRCLGGYRGGDIQGVIGCIGLVLGERVTLG